MVWIVVMGVAGCGKSSLGKVAAELLDLPMIEGDDFHPPANLEKMRAGIPLTNEDRAGWLDTLGREMARHAGGAVLACSALKRAYRDRLRGFVPKLRFIFLDIDRETARARVASRASSHLFPPSLVDSQFAALESPVGEPGVLQVQATAAPEALRAQVQSWIRSIDHP